MEDIQITFSERIKMKGTIHILWRRRYISIGEWVVNIVLSQNQWNHKLVIKRCGDWLNCSLLRKCVWWNKLWIWSRRDYILKLRNEQLYLGTVESDLFEDVCFKYWEKNHLFSFYHAKVKFPLIEVIFSSPLVTII